MSKKATVPTTTRKRVGPFSVVGVLGEGGMGTVLRCRRKDDEVAVKMIRPALLTNNEIRSRFEREAELLQSVDHPNVARVVAYDAKNKTSPWLATEYIDGPTLRDSVEEHGPMGEASWMELAEGVLSGLSAIHDTGILHRDIKPANIMLSPDGPKIIDFGISKEEGQTSLTNTQMFAGTVAFLAPERVERGEESQAADLFSAGLVLAIAAKGEHPWEDETTQTEFSILVNMTKNEPQLEDLTPLQKSLLSALLERQPHLRPTADQALSILHGNQVVPTTTKKVTKKDRGRIRKRQQWGVGIPGALARGVGVAVAAFLVTGITGLISAEGSGWNRLQEALVLGSLSLTDSLRAQPSFTQLDWILSQEANLTTEISARPSLITLAVCLALALMGRKYGSLLAGQPPAKVWGVVAAVSVPVSVVAVVLSWAVPGISGMMPWDWLFGATVSVVAFGFGMVFGGFAPDNSLSHWWLDATGKVIIIAGILSAGIFAGGILYGLISPDLAVSTPNHSAGPLDDASGAELLALVVFALFFLPTALAGGVAALLAGLGNTALRDSDFVYLQVLAEPSVPGLPLAPTPQGALITGLFLLVLLGASFLAGTFTATKRGQHQSHWKSLINLSIPTLTAGMLTFFVVRIGVDETVDLRGTFLLHTSPAHLAMTAGLAAICLLGFSTAMWAGGHQAIAPRVSSFLTGKRTKKTGEVVPLRTKASPTPARIGGAVVTAVAMVATLILPAGIGLIERNWAHASTPESVVAALASQVEISDGETLRDLLPQADNAPWLPPEALEGGQPMVGSPREISVENFHNRQWQPGQLDANATVDWSDGTETVTWDVPLSSEVERRFLFLRRVEYKAVPQPLTLVISTDPQLHSLSDAPIRINDIPVRPGTYSLSPGIYAVERDGIDLIAPFAGTFATTHSNGEVFVPMELDLPRESHRELSIAATEAAESCGNVRRSSCFTSDDVYRVQQVLSGRIPSSFYSSESTSFEDAGLSCDDGEDVLVSTSEVVRTVECTQSVSYETKYWDSRQIAEPIYDTRCARWWYSWWFGISCLQWETYQVGTNYRTVRGSLIDTVKYRSELPIRVSIPAGLDESGDFVIGEPDIN